MTRLLTSFMNARIAKLMSDDTRALQPRYESHIIMQNHTRSSTCPHNHQSSLGNSRDHTLDIADALNGRKWLLLQHIRSCGFFHVARFLLLFLKYASSTSRGIPARLSSSSSLIHLERQALASKEISDRLPQRYVCGSSRSITETLLEPVK